VTKVRKSPPERNPNTTPANPNPNPNPPAATLKQALTNSQAQVERAKPIAN
jgi:hypothetical protein